MPLLGFGEQWFHPDLPLADRFLVRLRGVVATDLLQIIDVKRPLHLAPVVAGGALGLDWTGVADRRLATVGHHFVRALDGIPAKRMSLGAAVLVALGIEDEIILSVELSPVREVGQG